MQTLREKIIKELKKLPLLNGDIEHIWRNIKTIPATEIVAILKRYEEIWETTSKTEQNTIHKDNAGRRAANTWILNQANRR